MMKEAVFNADDTNLITEANRRFLKHGYLLAASSNAGLAPGLVRLTYLPKSAFKASETSGD